MKPTQPQAQPQAHPLTQPLDYAVDHDQLEELKASGEVLEYLENPEMTVNDDRVKDYYEVDLTA